MAVIPSKQLPVMESLIVPTFTKTCAIMPREMGGFDLIQSPEARHSNHQKTVTEMIAE